MKLQVEYNEKCTDGTGMLACVNPEAGVVVVAFTTPPIGKDYWLFRVKLVKDQALLAFPKMNMLGVGFAIEESAWNRNLPIDRMETDADFARIWNHIKENRKYASVTKKMVIEALRLIKDIYKRFGQPRTNDEKFQSGSAGIPAVTNPATFLAALQADYQSKAPLGAPLPPAKLFERGRQRQLRQKGNSDELRN